jgi:ribosomal protein S18 acetylase RimI-like enzyme
MKIREFKIGDYSLVRDLWKTAGLVIRPGDELEDVKLKLQRDPDLFLVAELEGEIVGSVVGGWDGRRGWIYHLAVKPERQRKGIGARLVHEVEKRLVAKGAKKVNAQVYKSNERSSAFFKAIGYETHADLIMVGKFLKK